MRNKLIDLTQLTEYEKDGMTVMVSGFMGCGSPHKIIKELANSNVKDVTLICSDTGLMDYGVGIMVVNHQFKKIIATHVGLNPETGKQMNLKETEVELIPQGTLAERIRSGGYGLGGVLTPVGYGTVVEENKILVQVDKKTYLLEKPIRADVALIGAKTVDKKGNAYYEGTGRNFAPLMAMAADTVIMEADKVVEVGELSPEAIMTPHILVDYIIDGGENCG